MTDHDREQTGAQPASTIAPPEEERTDYDATEATWQDDAHAYEPEPAYQEEQPMHDPILREQTAGRPEESPFFWEKPPREGPGVLRMALAWFIAAVLGAGLGAGAAFYVSERGGGGGTVKVVEPPISNVSEAPAGSAAAVAEVVLPSIVRLDVAGALSGGVGSGIVYDDAGHIVTNNHVVANASRIEVNLPNGDTRTATIVGTAAPSIDIAVLRVDGGELSPATFGSTKNIRVGELAVALGSPFGLEATVTAGVISALHRNRVLPSGERFTDMIQTDAPINPGNSGGALANSRGEVIGVNTAIVGGEGNVGVGFAIPIEIVRKVADQIIATGRAQLAFLGIVGSNLPSGKGALVTEVTAGGPADAAGIRANDIIVELDGEAVDSMDQLVALLIERDVGDRVAVVLMRDGERITVNATLAARPEG